MSSHAVPDSPQAPEAPLLLAELNHAGEPAASSADELFHLYERVVETRPGTRDAEIFEKIRQWTFSDFTTTPHEFAGISKSDLEAWQARHRINLSAGHIRPDPIDLQRGYAWGHMRLAAAANRLHTDRPPPSAHEIRLAWSPGSR